MKPTIFPQPFFLRVHLQLWSSVGWALLKQLKLMESQSQTQLANYKIWWQNHNPKSTNTNASIAIRSVQYLLLYYSHFFIGYYFFVVFCGSLNAIYYCNKLALAKLHRQYQTVNNVRSMMILCGYTITNKFNFNTHIDLCLFSSIKFIIILTKPGSYERSKLVLFVQNTHVKFTCVCDQQIQYKMLSNTFYKLCIIWF